MDVPTVGTRKVTSVSKSEEFWFFIQVERVIQNRDRTQKNRIKQLESQLNMLREQLNNERLRRRDLSDRVYVSDVAKIGGSIYGINTVGGATYPQTDSFDYVIGKWVTRNGEISVVFAFII